MEKIIADVFVSWPNVPLTQRAQRKRL